MEERGFCLNRLPIYYNPNAPQPEVWLRFLSELLEPEDVLTLQEFMGYAVSKNPFRNRKSKQGIIDADIMGAISIGSKSKLYERGTFMNVKNEIKSIIVRSGMTMQQVVDLLSEEYGWSNSISNFSNKLSRGSLRYREAIQLADVMGYDLIWQKRRDQ